MKASQAIVECLKKENVDIIFGYPGATIIEIYEELRKTEIKHILTRHEQASGHCANGFARTTGKVGVCIVTSGPGATNVITAIATAYMDSIPLVIITGQVKSNLIGKDVFQEADVVGATESFTKHNYLVKNANDIPRIFKEAFYIARTGRPGPVLIDIPADLQEHDIKFEYPKEINIRGYKPTVEGNKRQIKRVVDRINRSKRPLVCIGGGISLSNAQKQLEEFIKKSKIPVVHTLMGKDGISSENPYYVGLIGSHGVKHANIAVKESDLLIFIGCRVADRTCAGCNFLGKNTDIVHIDIDPAEIGKNILCTIPVVGDCKNILEQLIAEIQPLHIDAWSDEIKSNKTDNELIELTEDRVNPKYALNILSQMVEEDAIITTDVGQNQIWTARNFNTRENMKFLASGGLGTMGYSLPAAIGAKMACRDKRVIAVVGDGGFQMSLSELGTIAEYGLKLIILLFNNSGLGMVREIQNNRYSENYGVAINSNPDFIKLVEAYGLKGRRVTDNKQLKDTFLEAMSSDKTFLIECCVDPRESTL